MRLLTLTTMGVIFSRGMNKNTASCPREPDPAWQRSSTILGAGCYWGTEKFFRQHNFKHGRILDVQVGFAGGSVRAPSYEHVCSGTTGHVEVAKIEFEGDEGMFAEMLKFFFSFHDPTTMNRQGNDRGTQYASVIFAKDERQKEVARDVIEDLQTAMKAGGDFYQGTQVVTQIRDDVAFWPAHQAHQRYLEKNPRGYCNHQFYFRKGHWPGVDPPPATGS